MSVQEGHEPRRGIVVVGRRRPLLLRPHELYCQSLRLQRSVCCQPPRWQDLLDLQDSHDRRWPPLRSAWKLRSLSVTQLLGHHSLGSLNST